MRIKKSNLLPRMFFVCSLLILLFPCFSFGQVIFEDNFDSQADWSPTQTVEVLCWDDCQTVPTGYNAYRLQGTAYGDTGHNTMNIGSDNARGGAGKAFTFWAESAPGGVWDSDGILGLYLDPDGYPELYVRFYVKFQSDWQWNTTPSPSQKFFRIVHYDGSGSPFKFFQTGNSRPLSTILLAKWNNGTADLALQINYRYEYVYYSYDATPSHVNEKTYYLGTGNYNGTGEDFWDTGMMGDGDWHSWEFYVKLNSSVGTADGIVRFWLDGVLEAEETDLAWSDEGSQASPRKQWNYVMLGGNNFNGYAATIDEAEQWYAIDDIVVSTTYIGPNYVIGCEDADSDGYDSSLCGGLDCDDSNDQVNPGRAEVCDNALDDDCDGSTDCDDSDCFFYSPSQCLDSDGDGYGNPASVTCTYPTLDCNDSNGSTNPGATDVCGNGVDENCDGSDSVCPTALSVGDRVETTMDLTVWSTHSSITGDLLGTQPTGSLGTLTYGPQDWEGDVWWQVDYDNAPDGWSVEDGLQLYTPPSGDSEPPSVPQSLQATAISTSRIDLTWNAATDNVGVIGYKIYRDGVQITTSLTTSYSDSGLQESTTYSYDVSAYDAAGNDGANSNSIQATTLEQPDTDGDGVRNICDNCSVDSNPGQEDTDGDGIGDACDPDDDNDNLTDDDEINIYGTNPLLFDTDSDGYGDGDEVALLSDPLDPLSIPEFATGDIAPRGAPDGVVDVADAMLVMRIAMGLISPTQLDAARGDVAPLGNPDGVIDISDVLLILRKAAGLVSF